MAIDVLEARRAQLTHTQRQLLRGLGRGLSNKEIALELGLSPHTVKNYLSTLYLDLDVQSRVQAALLARELGLLD